MKHEEAWEAVLADALQLVQNVHRRISSSLLWTTAFWALLQMHLLLCNIITSKAIVSLSLLHWNESSATFTVLNSRFLFVFGSLGWMFVAESHVVCSCVGADLRFGSPNTEKCEGKHAYKPPRCNQQTVSRLYFLALFHAHKHSCNPSPPKRTHTHTLTGSHLFLCSPRRMISLGWQVCLSLHISATRAPSLHPNAACSPIGPPLFLPLLLSPSARSDFSSAESNISFQSQQRHGLLPFLSLPLTIPLHPPLSTKQKMGAGAAAGYYLFELSILIIDQWG